VWIKKTTSADGTAGGRVGLPREFWDITTPDFFGGATGCGLADFFKFEQPRVGDMIDESGRLRRQRWILGRFVDLHYSEGR